MRIQVELRSYFAEVMRVFQLYPLVDIGVMRS